MNVSSPHATQDEAHQARLRELDAITAERDARRSEFESFRKQRLDEFMAGFSTITNKLKEMYQVCGGGVRVCGCGWEGGVVCLHVWWCACVVWVHVVCVRCEYV